MSVQSGRAKLTDGLKKLNRAWQEAREDWRDEVGQRFEQEHIQPLHEDTRAALSALGPLAETLQRARAECQADT
ncbi:MAG: hypothetical protein WD294_02730 [Phycisphaeraceae bacterium]